MVGSVQGRCGRRLVLSIVVAAASALLASAAPAEPWNFPQMGAGQPGAFFQADRPHVKARAARETGAPCAFPWSYSRGLRRCVCTREGYNLQHGGCAPAGASALCRDQERWSAKAGACVAAAPITAAVDGQPPVASTDTVAQESPPAEATKRAQRCFAELGLYQGPIDGVANGDTWTAYWYFKHANGLVAYRDFRAKPVQQKLASLCKGGEEVATGAPAEAEPQAKEEQPPLPVAQEPAAASRQSRLEIECLPQDLLALLRRTQGQAVKVKACEPVCLPAPKGLNQPELAALEARSGVIWCSACVSIDGRLALDDVRRIERAGKLQLCATPPKQLPHHGAGAGVGGKAYTRVRELYRALPSAAEDEAAIAIVIGNRNYAALPASEASRNDAEAIYSVLTEHLGYAQDNVVLVRDAKKTDLDRLFGAGSESEGELARRVRAHPGAKVLVYYSGLGATDASQSETYLLPVDSERYREELSGYKLSSLYAGLSQLEAKSVLVLLEAEFGRDHGAYVLPPNVPDTLRSVLPESPLDGLTVLAAADRGQRTLIDLSYDIGLFTRYLIEGLAGNADSLPVGNADGALDSAEIFIFTAAMVELAARKTYGLLQNPVYSSAATALVSAGGGGAVAARP